MTLKLFSVHSPHCQDLSHGILPATLRSWQQTTLQLSSTGTHFGYVFQGEAKLHRGDRSAQPPFPLQAGMYFCLPAAGVLDGTTSAGIVITCPDYAGVFSLGGPIEERGRLAYINGGTNSVLIPPPLLGEPCLHAMYLPPQIEQTAHTHPSYRIGIVVGGEGYIETPEGGDAIAPGDIFLIPADYEHRFCTGDKGLTAVVFHPDSEAGFSHRDNPMLRRTLVEGVSASALPHLQTPIFEGC
ncbi:MAG: cupin domain-containing protein [Thainema sp.]